AAGPVLERRGRYLVDGRRVPVAVQALGEPPGAVDVAIGVLVDDRLPDPLVERLVLGAAVHHAGRGVVVDEVDAMADDHVDAAVEALEDRPEERAYGVASLTEPLPHPYVGHPLLDQQVEITGVHRDGVTDGQLL